MKQSWRIFQRDVKRLLRVKKAWVIVIGVLITPALYAWFNINAFWDPYSSTANIRVAVANLDRGAESELTGKVNIGDEVVSQLKDNDQLGWQFLDENDAHRAVERGDVYAAIVIPEDFSEDLLSLTTGDFTQPALQYFVNEKTSAIAPKITDVGASQLDKQITESFKKQVAEAATEAIKDAGDSIELRLLNARNDTLDVFDETTKTLGAAQKNIVKVQDGITSSRESLASTRKTLTTVDATLRDVQKAVAEAQAALVETQKQLVTFSDAASKAYLKGTTLLADSAASAQTSISHLTQELNSAHVRISASIDEVQKTVEANGKAIDKLDELLADSSLPPEVHSSLQTVVDQLKTQNAEHAKVLENLQKLSESTQGAAQAVDGATTALATAMDKTKTAASRMRSLVTETIPAVNSAVSTLSSSAGAFSSALKSQQTALAQADTLLAGIDQQLLATSGALDSATGDLEGIISDVTTARADVRAMNAASEWGLLSALTGLNSEQIAEFVASPVTVNEEVVFPIESYGSAMAALFTNLSLWIGAFVLMVIFKIEVDTEGLRSVTVRQAYLGRFFLLALLAVLQALIVCMGNLVIGIQTVSALAFVATGMFTALVYVSIIYALSVAFGHVGRGLCVLLVIMQIPGASGLYPIELMPGFFRAIYPLLPFSYGIDAMRETIAGFYGGHYWSFIGVLALMMALSFALGLFLRRRLSNFNLLFNRQIASTDLLIGEKVQVVGSGYRLTDVIHALQNRDEYRDDVARRARPFTQHYPALLKGTLLVGVIGMLALAVIAWAIPGGKALLLGLWVLWCLLVMGFLVVLEYVKQSFVHAEEIALMKDTDLREAVLAESRGVQSALALDPAFAMQGAGARATAYAPATRPLPVNAGTDPLPEEDSADSADQSEIDATFASLFQETPPTDDPMDPSAEDETLPALTDPEDLTPSEDTPAPEATDTTMAAFEEHDLEEQDPDLPTDEPLSAERQEEDDSNEGGQNA